MAPAFVVNGLIADQPVGQLGSGQKQGGLAAGGSCRFKLCRIEYFSGKGLLQNSGDAGAGSVPERRSTN